MVCLAVLFTTAGQLQAAFIVGGTGFVTQANADRLETWLGEGPITITNIFTKQTGNTAADFHNAVDGKGRTFSVIEVLSGHRNGTHFPDGIIQPQVIGGYNPKSWNNNETWNLTPKLEDRTAFLFNLTSTEKQNQNSDRFGEYQTYNSFQYGPNFGAGSDLRIEFGLDIGIAQNFSYGGTSFTNAITIGGSDYDVLDSIGRIEVYTIISNGPVAVPEPATIVIWGIGALSMGLVARRRVRKISAV
jgi:hypothetical protein